MAKDEREKIRAARQAAILRYLIRHSVALKGLSSRIPAPATGRELATGILKLSDYNALAGQTSLIGGWPGVPAYAML
jgi:hypothetical protein